MNWLLLQSGPCPAAFNMALDKALLEAMPRLGEEEPVFALRNVIRNPSHIAGDEQNPGHRRLFHSHRPRVGAS